MFPYRLAPSVYACASDAGAVLLNLQNDAYMGIDAVQSYALSRVVANWPSSQDSNGHSMRPSPAPTLAEAVALAQILCESGLLIESRVSNSTMQVAPPVAEIESELIAWEHMSWRDIRSSHVLHFIGSLLTAMILLRSRKFAAVVERARARKRRYASTCVPMHAPTVRTLLSAFFHIRAFFYAPKNRCLLDSLALLEFLARYRQFPQWVIGVQIAPFGSHSWVQHDEFVLNGTTAYVRAYTPILSV